MIQLISSRPSQSRGPFKTGKKSTQPFEDGGAYAKFHLVALIFISTPRFLFIYVYLAIEL